MVRFVHAGCKRANICDFQMRKKNRQRHSGQYREMKRSAGRGPQGFRRKGAGGAGLAGSGGDRAGCPECCGGAQDRTYVSGVLNTSENHEKRSTGRGRGLEQLIQRRGARLDQSGYALRVLGVGKTFE